MPNAASPDPRPNVYISVPSWDRGEHPYHARSVMALANNNNLRLICTTHALGDFLMRARNRQLFQFLNLPQKPDFFFCVGSDIDFTPEYFTRIVERNLPIVAGLYAVKEANVPGTPPRWCMNTLPQGAPVSSDGLMEIAAGGTDFICFRRDALETMIQHPLVLKYSDDFPGGDKTKPHHHLFNFGVVNTELASVPTGEKLGDWVNTDWQKNRLLSEDYWACQIARACGIKIMLDVTGYCGHWDGRTRYPTNAPPSKPSPKKDLAEQFKLDANTATVTPEHGGAQ